jgi:hypothetical protein
MPTWPSPSCSSNAASKTGRPSIRRHDARTESAQPYSCEGPSAAARRPRTRPRLPRSLRRRTTCETDAKCGELLKSWRTARGKSPYSADPWCFILRSRGQKIQ